MVLAANLVAIGIRSQLSEEELRAWSMKIGIGGQAPGRLVTMRMS